MTTCKTIQPRLTAYLDGELTADDGSVVRGHLRECATCRQIARDEASLRDSLRAMPPLDPPASLWAGVQARLAAAEVADARTARWRRMLVRWKPTLPRLVGGGMVADAAVTLLYWRTHRADEGPANRVVAIPVPRIEAAHHATDHASGDTSGNASGEPSQRAAAIGSSHQQLSVPSADDVTADL